MKTLKLTDQEGRIILNVLNQKILALQGLAARIRFPGSDKNAHEFEKLQAEEGIRLLAPIQSKLEAYLRTPGE